MTGGRLFDYGGDGARRRVLNVGSGPAQADKLHPAFQGPHWREVRLDVEPAVAPDILASMVDMRGHVADADFDAVWSSHNLEHLHAHEVPPALGEFARVLRREGLALITCPDVEAIAGFIVEKGFDAIVYESPAGPIRPADMLWGHGGSIAAGFPTMAHRTGFTAQTLGELALGAGFAEVRVASLRFALWALCLMPDCDPASIAPWFGSAEGAALFAAGEGADPALR